ncbi:kinase-like protein [Agrocybe pediades]|nr:kinase-like protein [Agrocybe pediades]
MSSSLSAPVIVPVTTERPYQPVLFDPDGEVKTSDRLNAQWDEVRGPMLNNYVRYHLIGKGQHGEVYLCKRLNHTKAAEGVKARHIPVAMKSIRRDNPRAQQWKKLRRGRLPASADHTPMADKLNTVEAKIKREIAIMKKLIHPQVVRLYEVIDDRMASKIYMVMEYLGGGEVKWTDANKNPVLTTTQSRRILRDALLGLEYLHFQGIIHRDIKPANLLWTEDRRQVKIADFGVSHFSYAQRLAAGAAAADEDPYDPILLDESGLTKRAGTPAFYAPEVIYEHTYGIPGSISSSNSTAMQSASSLSSNNNLSSPLTPPGELERPPITKAIDVWALGATFYCFLTGRTPFDAAVPGSEFSLYGCICNEDWTVPPTLGADKIPSGGRIPVGDSEGATIVRLLDHFLQKDQTKRVTLAEVKRHPWTLKDLHDPETWLRITSPRPELIAVSLKETSDAMSAVHFRWRWGGKLARHVSSLFRSGNAASDAGAGGVAPETPAPTAGRTPQGIVDGAAPPNVGRNPAHTTKQQYKNKEKERNRNGHEDNYPSAAVSESGQPRWRTPTSPSHQHPTGTTSSTVPLLADSSKSYSASSSKTNGKGKEKEKEKEKATTLSPIAKQASSKKLSATGASSPPRQTNRRGSVSRTIERVASGSRSLFASGNPQSAGTVATYSNASASGGFIVTGAAGGSGSGGVVGENGINGSNSNGGGGGSGGTTPTSDKRARLIGLLQHISTWRPTKFNGGSSSPGAGANGRGGSGYEQLASHVRSVGGGGGRREGAPRGEGGTGKGKAKMTTNQRGDLPGPSRNLRRSEEALRSYRTPNAAGAGVNYNYNSYSYKNNGGSNYENGASTNHGGEDRKPNTANNNNVDLNTATSNNNNNALTAAQRASSWGPLEDLTAQAELISVQSVEQMMMLNEHTMTVGAGGLAEEPIPPIPPVSSAEMVAKFGRFGFGVGGSSSSPGAAGGASGSGDAVAAGVSANGADEGGGDEKEWDDSVLLDSESSFSTRYGALIMSDDDFSSLHSFDAGASVHQGGQLVGGGVGLVGASGNGGGGGGGGVPEVVVVGGGRGGLLAGAGPAPVVVSRSITAAAVDAGVDVDEDRQSGSSVWHDGASLEEEDGDEFEEEDDDEYSLEEEQGVTFSPRPKRRHVVDVVDDDDDDDEGDGDEEHEEEEEEEERMVEEERRRVK